MAGGMIMKLCYDTMKKLSKLKATSGRKPKRNETEKTKEKILNQQISTA